MTKSHLVIIYTKMDQLNVLKSYYIKDALSTFTHCIDVTMNKKKGKKPGNDLEEDEPNYSPYNFM